MESSVLSLFLTFLYSTILAPATFNGQNVILSQEQQRRIYDTLNTAIVGNSFGLNNINPGNVRVLHAQKQFFPGGVTFTFNQQQSQPQQMTPDMCCKCPATNATIFDNTFHSGVNTFFPSTLENTLPSNRMACGLDCLNYQQLASRNPFQLKFHADHSTSSSDLPCHFTAIPASTKECENGYQKPKKKENESSMDKENKKENTKKKKKEKKKRKDNSSSCDATESSDSEHNTDSERPKKFRWWNKHKHEKTFLINASDTDEEKSEPNEKEGNKNKKRKNNLSDNTPNTNFSDSSAQQSSTSEHSHSEET